MNALARIRLVPAPVRSRLDGALPLERPAAHDPAQAEVEELLRRYLSE